MKVIMVLILLITLVLGAKEKEADCYYELSTCRAVCYDKKDITGDCILECYHKNEKCMKEQFK